MSTNRKQAFINLSLIGSGPEVIKRKRFHLRREKYFSIKNPFVAPTFVAFEVGQKVIMMDFMNLQKFKKEK
jgi:hypothetical protein